MLVDRIMSRVCNEQIPITKFLMITYTRAAAAELRAKITTELATRLATNPGDTFLQQQLRLVYAAQISTVHAFCGNLLHSYAAEAGLSSDFRVGEEQECQTLKASSMEDLLESVYKTIASTPDIKAFIEELAYGRDDSAVPAILYDVYDTIQAHP
ncbi:MAG: UvrD-helicase domain-containing protein, partial [Oscillospiraceae bacterium]